MAEIDLSKITWMDVDYLIDGDPAALGQLAWNALQAARESAAEVERLRATEARVQQLVLNLRHTGTYLDGVLADMLQRELLGGAS